MFHERPYEYSYGYPDIPMVCRLPPLPPLANYNNHSPESCGHFGMIPLTNHDSDVWENSEVVIICPDHCVYPLVFHCHHWPIQPSLCHFVQKPLFFGAPLGHRPGHIGKALLGCG